MKKGLGKGLSALFPEELKNAEVLTGAESDTPRYVRISRVSPNPEQPRTAFDETALLELSASIKQHGILSPLLVRPADNGFYTILAGERRWRAARLAGLDEVPILIKDCTDEEAAEIALIENLQREDLNAIEEAAGYQRLMKDFGLTQADVASRVAKSRPAIANALRLLSLPEAVLSLVRAGELSGGHARTLLPLGENALPTAQQVIKDGLSVRETERLVKRLLTPPKEAPAKPFTVDYAAEVEKDLSSFLGRRVTLKSGRGTGRLELEYYDNEDLDRLIALLKNRPV